VKPIGPTPPGPTESEPTLGPSSGWQLNPADIARSAVDPLLGCLVALTKRFERPYSAEALRAGLPLVDGKLTPGLFQRAAERAGISARIVRRQLDRIPDMVLPVILLLEEGDACILLRRLPKGMAEILVPETGEGTMQVALRDLGKRYAGYTIFARAEYRSDGRLGEADTSRPASWFWGTMARYWPHYTQVVLAAILINCFALAMPLFIMNVYDRVVPNDAVETLWVLAIGAGTVIGFDLLLRIARGHFIDSIGKSADVVLSARVFEQVMNMQLRTRPQSAGGFANTLREFESVRDFISSATVTTLVDVPFVFLFIFVIWMVAGNVALVPLLAIPLLLAVVLALQWPMSRAVQRTYREAQMKHGILVEAIGGLETIKSLSAEGRMQRSWERFVGMTAESSLAARFYSATGVNFTIFIQQFTSIAMVVLGVYLIKDGLLTVGGLVASTILVGRALAPMAQVATLLARLNQSLVALKALNAIMALQVERPPGKAFVNRTIRHGTIELQNVTFSYPGSAIPAINGLSAKIAPGEKVGIIGRIGSGKSTVARLILGLYPPDQGSVLVDGTDIRQMDPADLRRGIGSIMQDVFLFHGTVRENIAMSAPYADDAMLLRAARIAGVDDFIGRHPSGYDLMVGERGEGLSGGQRQAIALARAILSDPPILLLDEPTSSMDSGSEKRFIKQVQEVMSTRTVVIVTHRASLLDLVNRVIVLDQGKIAADGPREQIMQALAQGKIKAAN
jgi:ATP-binding cassette, subfamily C, bacterial LapB